MLQSYMISERGEALLIERYIEAYGRRLYGLCRTLIGDDADDLYQETWLRAYTRLGTYDTSRPFEAWITGICINTYRDEIRKRKRRGQYEVPITEENTEMLGRISDGEDGFRDSEIRDAVDRLPEKLRETVILYYYNGFDEKTTAKVLKIPQGTVKSRLSQAKMKLKGMLSDGET